MVEISRSLTKFGIGKVKLLRSQIYLPREIRDIVGWKTEEDLSAITSNNLVVLFKMENFEKISEAIESAIRRLEEIKKML